MKTMKLEAKGETMGKGWADLRKLIAYSPGGVVSKSVLKTGSLEISLFCMAEETKISEHTSTRNAVVQVLEGKGVFVLGKEAIMMSPGVVIHMKPDTVHSLYAEEDLSFSLTLFN